MQQLPREIYSVKSVRKIDRCAIENCGIAGYELMTRAAGASLRAARQHFPDAERWQIVCGPGNNGGDGYVLARLAIEGGLAASIVAMTDTRQLGGDAAKAHADLLASGAVVKPWDGALDGDADLIVDAMLGSGLQRPLGGRIAAAAAAMNAHRSVVMALDIPSGIHGDTGQEQGDAVVATLTVTFVGLKAGLFEGAGPRHCGHIEFAGLDIPVGCYDKQSPLLRRLDNEFVRAVLPRRARDAHKGDYGHVVVIGGGEGMPGAALLCGEAALRSGAGRVTVATGRKHAAAIAAARPELMVRGIESADDIDDLLAMADVVAIGPGLGTGKWAQALVERVSQSPLASVWDADALNVLADRPGTNSQRIITPHPGEAGRLLGIPTKTVQADRRVALAELQRRYGGVVVLKGAGSLVSRSGAPGICTAGNPGMAAPGMGDVLTGIIASLEAQGLSGQDAALAGVQIHARAGDRASAQGERGMLASDLLAQLRDLVNPR